MKTVAGFMLATLAALSGCKQVTLGGIESDIAGTYEAVAINVTQNGVQTNLIDEGATVTVTLNENGITSGSLFLPGGNEDGTDLTADLAGTWEYDGAMVRLSHTADTFLRDIDFTPISNRLVGQDVFSGVTVSVTLLRQ